MTTAFPSLPTVSNDAQTGDAVAPIALVGVVMLAGTVRQTELSRAAGRARNALPVRPGVTLGDCWVEYVSDLRRALNQPDLPLIVATNSIASPHGETPVWSGATVMMDSELPRGSGGALRDAVQNLDPTGFVLIVPAHSYPRQPLVAFVDAMARIDADVVIHADGSSSPTGLFLCRCGSLAALPSKGFVDLKEQALPQIAAKHEVRVVRTDHAAPLPIRTLDGYIHALRAAAGVAPRANDTPEEDWKSTFALTEPGAAVDPTARLHDSIVLAGGRVGAGAVVVRSLIGPGGTVSAGEAVFDALVPAGTSAL